MKSGFDDYRGYRREEYGSPFASVIAEVFIEQKMTKGLWIGAQRLQSDNSSAFVWIPSGSPVASNMWYVSDASFVTKGDCAELLPRNSEFAGKMSPADCDSAKPFVCMKKSLPNNPSVEISGGCHLHK